MIMEDYDQIHYLKCPHFTVGRVDQWGEHGYLLYEGMVYAYEEDRKDQCGRTYAPTSVADFLMQAGQLEIAVPDEFIEKLKEISK